MRNKFFAMALSLIIILMSFASCASGSVSDNEKPRVVATNFAMYDFARAVCGDAADVEMLLTPGSESHDFEATLEDVARIASADVFVYVGGESETWVEGVFESIGDTNGIKKVRAMDAVELCTADHDHETEDHGLAEEYDEHVWTSIPNAILIIREIERVIASVSPENESYFQECADKYVAELELVDREMCDMIESAGRNTIVVADRFPFVYMAQHYGLHYVAAFDGCTSDVEPSLSVINSLVREVNERGIDTIFVIEFSDRKTAEAIAAETGCVILEISSAHNVTKTEFEEGITYADIMRRNMLSLDAALN